MSYSSESHMSSDIEPEFDDESVSEEEDSQDLESHQQYRNVTLPAPVPTTVCQAIHSASADRVLTLLLEIVTTIPAASALAEQRLLRPVTQAAFSASAGSSLKRKAYEMCKNCNSEFSVDNNHKGACTYHEGEKDADMDSDMWADHDESCHGDVDSFVDDPYYAEGFIWSCCEQSGSAEGCIISKHEPKEDASAKKARQILQPISRNAQTANSFRGPGGRQLL